MTKTCIKIPSKVELSGFTRKLDKEKPRKVEAFR